VSGADRLRLMIPGPIELAPEVLEVMAEPLVAHYGEEWTQFYRETIERLKSIFRTQERLFLIPGSGSACLDAAIGSTLYPDRRALVVQNGFFGERLAEIAGSYTPHVTRVNLPAGQPVDIEEIERRIRTGRFDALLVTHCETAAGILNPIQEMGVFCKQHGVLLIVDAISSLAIEPFEMDSWGIDVCVAASQKGLEAPPGLGAVAVGRAAWEIVERTNRPGWYLSLKVWQDYETRWHAWHPYPVTHAVANVRALRVGVDRILEEGLDDRLLRHERVCRSLRGGLGERGFPPLVADEFAAHGVTAVTGGGRDISQLLWNLMTKHGLLLAGGMGDLAGAVFRVGHMGPGANDEAVEGLLEALDEECT